MKKISAKDFFNTEMEITENLSNTEHIKNIINFIKNEYGINTNRDELLLNIKCKNVFNTQKVIEKKYYLTVKPTQDLLRKFEKEFPEMIV